MNIKAKWILASKYLNQMIISKQLNKFENKLKTMQTETVKRTNVAPSSTEGHFVTKAKKVVNLDNVNETFHVEGASQLETKNHTTLEMKESCLITCQTVYDPFKNAFVKSKD